jgi:hypothetical protein
MQKPVPRIRITELRSQVLEQIRQWDIELSEMRERVDAVESTANSRVTALLNTAPQCPQSDIDEAMAIAYRADAQARHQYEHQLAMLRGSIDAQVKLWQKELRALQIPSDLFWQHLLHGNVRTTWQRLTHLSEHTSVVWHGFGVKVEQSLRKGAERVK